MPALLLGTKTIFHFPRPVSAPCSACKSLYALWASPGTKPSAKGPQLSLAPRHQPSATFIFDTMGTDLYTFHLTHLGGWKGRTGFVYAAGQVPALYPWLQPHPKHRSSCLNGNPSFLFSGSSFSKSSLFHARSVAVEGPKNIKAGFGGRELGFKSGLSSGGLHDPRELSSFIRTSDSRSAGGRPWCSETSICPSVIQPGEGGKGSYWIVISHYCMNVPRAFQLPPFPPF